MPHNITSVESGVLRLQGTDQALQLPVLIFAISQIIRTLEFNTNGVIVAIGPVTPNGFSRVPGAIVSTDKL